MNEQHTFDVSTDLKVGVVRLLNYEELKKELTELRDRYASLVLGEDQVKIGKAEATALNALANRIDEKRKEIKKAYLRPFETVEEQFKELTQLVKEARQAIKNQTDAYDQLSVDEKLKEVESKFNELCEKYQFHYINFEELKAGSTQWKNKGKTAEQIGNEIETMMKNVQKDLNAIESMFSKEEAWEVKAEYIDLWNSEHIWNLSQVLLNHQKEAERLQTLKQTAESNAEQGITLTEEEPEIWYAKIRIRSSQINGLRDYLTKIVGDRNFALKKGN